MVVLGRWVFLMSEVPLYLAPGDIRPSLTTCRARRRGLDLAFPFQYSKMPPFLPASLPTGRLPPTPVQVYLPHEKNIPHGTLQ